MGENAQAMSDSAVKAIQQSVETRVIDVDEINYITRPVFAPPIEATAETLKIHTLSGLVDYLASNIDDIFPTHHAIHIVGFGEVNLVTVLDGRPKRRDVLVSVEANPLAFRFGYFYPCEEFNIALQSLFVDEGDRAAVLRVVGTIKAEVVGQTDDDGTTQTVTAKAGIARVDTVSVPNPVTLTPYRTFAEVAQPSSPFILRMKSGLGAGTTPTCALFEADGGKWRIEAIENIARHLRVKIAELGDPMKEIAVIA